MKSAGGDQASPGCPTGFEEFSRAELKPLLTILLKAGARWDEAEDAAAEAMTDILERWPQVLAGTIEDPQAYVRTAAQRAFINRRIRDRKRIERSMLSGHLVPQNGDIDAEACLWEDLQAVEQLLDRLPPTQRKVMELEILAGYKTREIAELLGKTPAAIRKNRQLARERLLGLNAGKEESDD